jgi:hypothetical protein
MSCSPRSAVTPQAVVGVSICLMGIALTLDNLGIYELRSPAELWPIVPVSIGVLTLMYGESKQDYVKGTVWLAVGAFFIFRTPLIHDMWPLLLIALGGYLVWRSRTGPPPARKRRDAARGHEAYAPPEPSVLPPPIPESHRHAGPFAGFTDPHADLPPGSASGPTNPPGAGNRSDPERHEYEVGGFGPARPATGRGQRPSLFAFMAGVRRQVAGVFAGAEATAIMGGIELDLRHATMESDEAIIDTFALWAGIEIWVPAHWEVVSQGLPLMASFEDKTRVTTQGRNRPRLIVRGVAVMGSVEIKN